MGLRVFEVIFFGKKCACANFYAFCMSVLQWHWGMGPSVKHVLRVLEWSYVVLEKPFFSKIGFGSG